MRDSLADVAHLLLEEAGELASLWLEVRENPTVGALTARDLLAVWAHLLRFPANVVEALPAQRLCQIVAAERERVVSLALSLTPGGWQQVAGGLAKKWEEASTLGEFEHLERQTWELFDDLDRNSLAVHAASLLLADSDPLLERLNQVREIVRADEEFLVEHPEAFVCIGPLASALLRAYRVDLDETDESLWLTTLKHHALEQLSEQARDGLLGQPGAEDAADLKATFRG